MYTYIESVLIMEHEIQHIYIVQVYVSNHITVGDVNLMYIIATVVVISLR